MSKEAYEPLISSDGDFDFERASSGRGSAKTEGRARMQDWLLIAETALLLIVLAAWWSSARSTATTKPTCQAVYSPVQDIMEYGVKKWTEDAYISNIYKAEPSDEVDKAWEDLYNDFGISQIPKWQADLLLNPTLPIPADPDYYIIQLTVFHQLHCLNLIRKALHPGYYVDPVTGSLGTITHDSLPIHVGHCVESIRQGLMCAADISPIVWEWNDQNNSAAVKMDNEHSCRNYDALVDWAKVHKTQHDFNMYVRVGGV